MKNLKILCVITVFSFLFFNMSAQVIKTGILKVGAAKECINPPENLFLSGVEYFDFPNRDFIGIHDSLYVRSIIIDNGITKLALVTMDIAKVPSGDDFTKSIVADLGIKPEYLFLSATHDHNTIEFKGEDYKSNPKMQAFYDLLKSATKKSLFEANARLQPAQIGYATGKAYVNNNRDAKEGFHLGYNPDGPSDKTVAVVSFTSLKGETIAVYANYGVHGTLMYRAKTKNGHPEVTGDLPGATTRYIEKNLKGAIAVWANGAGGDQSPVFSANYNTAIPHIYSDISDGYAILDVVSRRLGDEIIRVTKSIQNTSSEIRIWGKKTSVTVPGRKREGQPQTAGSTQSAQAPVQIKMVDGDPVTIPLHLLMINDLAVAGVSGEVYTEIAMHLKEKSVFDRTFMVTLLPNDVGYIPTDAGFMLPAEKAMTNRIKPGYAEPAIINTFLEMMNEYISLKTN